jgi:hypothetical protein
MVGKGNQKSSRTTLPSQNILGLALCLFHESVFGVFHVTPAAIRFSDDSAVFVIDSDSPANRCVTSSNTASSKASLQFQLLGREKGPFQSSTDVEMNFLVLCGFPG